MDALSTIETRVKAHLAEVEGIRRVYGFEDMPLTVRDLPGIVVDLGNETFDNLEANDMEGEGHLVCTLQLDVLVIVDSENSEFRPTARAIRNGVMKAMADRQGLDLPEVEKIRFVAAPPQQFKSEKGSQGGYHIAYQLTFTVPESAPDTFAPRH